MKKTIIMYNGDVSTAELNDIRRMIMEQDLPILDSRFAVLTIDLPEKKTENLIPVVRCKDCWFASSCEIRKNLDRFSGFCSRGRILEAGV